MKVVGSLADAEDIVQDTFVKWLTIDHKKIENTKAYLIKSVTNNCINHLNSFKKKGFEYLENLNSGTLFEKDKESEITHFDKDNEVSEALAVLDKKLDPIEKGMYLLREVFNFEYEDLQELFDKKKENCRQIFSRVQAKLKKESSKINFDSIAHSSLVENFKTACYSGQLADLVNNIKKEIELKLERKNKISPFCHKSNLELS